MSVTRGQVILVYLPNVGAPGGKVRPALVVQSDHNNVRLNETIIVAITTNISRAYEATQLLIEPAKPDAAGCGLFKDSVVRCERLYSIPQANVRRVIGKLSNVLEKKIDECLKKALGIS